MWPFKTETLEEKRDRLYPNYREVIAPEQRKQEEEQRKREEEQRIGESCRQAILDKYDLMLGSKLWTWWCQLATKDECFDIILGRDQVDINLIRPGSDAEKQLDDFCKKFRDTVDSYK